MLTQTTAAVYYAYRMAETHTMNQQITLASTNADKEKLTAAVGKPRYSLPDLGRLTRLLSQADRTGRRKESEISREDRSESESSKMYIIVKYADNQSLIVNPMCSVVNLLSSIKSRTGHAQDKDMLIDLSDETGLIQDLEVHGRDYATKHLSSHGTYILMKKRLLLEETEAAAANLSQALQAYDYIPLLERCVEIYPNFRIHLSEAQRKKLKPLKNSTKSPSPAGKMGTKSNNNHNSSNRSLAGRPPRSSSRGRKN